MPINIRYEISNLGFAYQNQSCRAGIFRVTENIIHELSRSPACCLSLCFCQSLESVDLTLNYLKSISWPQTGSLPCCKGIECKRQNVKKIHALSERICNTSNPVEKFFLMFLKKCLHMSTYGTKLSVTQDLSGIDIFHSAYYAIPNQIQRIRKIKCFQTINDIIPVIYPNYFQKEQCFSFKRDALSTLSRNTWICCPSQRTKADLRRYFKNKIDFSKIFVIPWAVSSDFFYPCDDQKKISFVLQKYGIPDQPYILSLFTIEPRKNALRSLRAFAKLLRQESIKELNFVFVGAKGWDYDDIFAETLQNDALKNRVIFTGYVEDKNLAPLYSRAMAFIYLSLYEGFGLPPLEAMQCGVPVITSNNSALPEVVGNAGIMITATDEEALSRHIWELYDNAALRKNLSLKSIEQAKRFSWAKTSEEMIKAYQIALGK